MDDVGSEIRITATPEQAWQLVEAIATDDDFREALSNRGTAADALRRYGVELSEDAIPDEVTLPTKDEARDAMDRLRKGGAYRPAPHVGFRPPWCYGAAEQVHSFAPHSAAMNYVFAVIDSRAEPPPEK